MFAPNCIDYALVFHACALSGVIVSPVAPNFQVAELKQQLQVLIFYFPLFVRRTYLSLRRGRLAAPSSFGR
jgi:acyl-CoA synthetase (AMP-forming)/AMP-acid ligase II